MSRPIGAAAILANKDIDGNVVPNESNPVTVVGAVNVFSGDPERTIALIYNLGANVVYLGFSADVGATNGILLPPNGGFVSINAVEDYDLVTYPIWAFCTVAGNQLYTINTRRENKVRGS